ncbi:MAG TPA: YggT family protein [Acidobacteriota bacterium]|jgi:uncharacterized protein YggT (Ycf19 family)
MAEDDKLAVDEARRISQHESVKSRLGEGVQSEITRSADDLTREERTRADAVAEKLKHKAVNEVVETESELERARGVARISQVIDYLFYLLYGILSLEIILELIGARQGSGFKQLIDTLAAPFLAPFRGLVPDPGSGTFQFRMSYIIALIVYVLVHLGINGLLRIFVHKKTEV